MTGAPFLSMEQACNLREALDRTGRRLVFTNGCFDILHAGHVGYLEQARALGDALLVALNSDRSIGLLKGPSRPVNPLEDRIKIMQSLRFVDGVMAFDELRTTALIEQLRPHIFAKGGDYSVDTMDASERRALEGCRAEIRFLPKTEGRSTSAIVSAIQQKVADLPIHSSNACLTPPA